VLASNNLEAAFTIQGMVASIIKLEIAILNKYNLYDIFIYQL